MNDLVLAVVAGLLVAWASFQLTGTFWRAASAVCPSQEIRCKASPK